MHKLDQVKSLFNCNLCKKMLVEPVTFPCGNTLCKKHLIELINSENVIECILCQRKHIVPVDGFLVNKIIQNGLNIELNQLKLNPIFESCKKTLEEAKRSASDMKNLQRDSDDHIKRYFEGIKIQVRMQKENLKMKIDMFSDEMIQTIENTESECIRMSKEVSQLSEEIGRADQTLANLSESFDSFEINDKKFEDIKLSADKIKIKFKSMIKQFKESLHLNEKYQFSFNEVKMEDVFGKFTIENLNKIDSCNNMKISADRETARKHQRQKTLGPQRNLNRKSKNKMLCFQLKQRPKRGCRL